MENDELSSDTTDGGSATTPVQKRANPEVYLYVGIISFFFLMPGNVAYAPLQFIYKNQLHLDAHQTSLFKLIINVTGIMGFVWGIARDRFNPLKMGDRGFILVFGIVSALIYVVMAEAPLTVTTLGVALSLIGVSTGLVGAAFQALMRNVSEARLMTGRMSTIYNFFLSAVPALFVFVGGWLFDHVSWRPLLMIIAACYLAVGLCGFIKPRLVLEGIPSGGDRSFEEYWKGVKLLMRYRGYWVAVAMWGVWAFAPAAITPLQYFMTDTLKMSASQYGIYNSILGLSFIPTTLLFGLLCKRMSLWPLLLVSTVIAIPQWVPVIFIHSAVQSYVVAMFMGLAGGLASVAYWGLLLRACPQDLAGSGMMVAGSLALLVTELGNVLGGYLYDKSGFTGCAIWTTAAYALLLPLCFLLPRALVEPRDDEHVPTEEELVAA